MPLENMSSFRFAVIGDVHSNAFALKSCLQSIYEYESCNSIVDSIVFMGDLMTYGVHPNETLREVSELVSSREVKLILGNHDQLYIDLFGDTAWSLFYKLPDWIKESVDFHLSIVDRHLFSSLPFLSHYSYLGVLFSHANFFSLDSVDPNWSYVNTFDDHCRQIEILSQHEFRLGVLGHTHRASTVLASPWLGCEFCYSLDGIHQIGKCFDLAEYPCSVANAGSIGQPRDKLYSNPANPEWMLVELDQHGSASITYMPFLYDCDSHLKDLSRSRLSTFCLKKLTSFFQYS